MKPVPSTGRPDSSRLLTDHTDGAVRFWIPSWLRISALVVVGPAGWVTGGAVGSVRVWSAGSTAAIWALSDDV